MKSWTTTIRFGLLVLPFTFQAITARADDSRPKQNMPVQVQANVTIQSGTSGARLTIYRVPRHKLLKIEYVSCNFDVPGAQTVFPSLRTRAGGTAAFLLPVVRIATIPASGGDIVAISQQVRIFAAAGTSVELEIERVDSSGGIVGGCAIAGELTGSDQDHNQTDSVTER